VEILRCCCEPGRAVIYKINAIEKERRAYGSGVAAADDTQCAASGVILYGTITQNRERRATFCAEKNQLAILILCTLASKRARGAGKRKEEKRRLFEANNSETAGSALLLYYLLFNRWRAAHSVRCGLRFVVICNGKESRGLRHRGDLRRVFCLSSNAIDIFSTAPK
jgi:hypothetical protein